VILPDVNEIVAMQMLAASAVADRFIFDVLKANTSVPKTKQPTERWCAAQQPA
jgi:hypothetical protein